MRLTPKSLLIVFAFGLMLYAMVDGIRYGSGWGVAMAIGAMCALYITLRLTRKLARLNEEASEED